jgi:hypothetical protein
VDSVLEVLARLASIIKDPLELGLLTALCVVSWLLYRQSVRSRKMLEAEIRDCMLRHRISDQRILTLTGFLMESIGLAREHVGRRTSAGVEDLQRRVNDFQVSWQARLAVEDSIEKAQNGD